MLILEKHPRLCMLLALSKGQKPTRKPESANISMMPSTSASFIHHHCVYRRKEISPNAFHTGFLRICSKVAFTYAFVLAAESILHCTKTGPQDSWGYFETESAPSNPPHSRPFSDPVGGLQEESKVQENIQPKPPALPPNRYTSLCGRQ